MLLLQFMILRKTLSDNNFIYLIVIFSLSDEPKNKKIFLFFFVFLKNLNEVQLKRIYYLLNCAFFINKFGIGFF